MRRGAIIFAPIVAIGILAAATSHTKKIEPSVQMHAITRLATDPASAALARVFDADTQALVDAEELFFIAEGRYTANWRELPRFRPKSTASIVVTASATWLSVSGELQNIEVHHVTVWRPELQQVASGYFSLR